jgi:hypothetical protein
MSVMAMRFCDVLGELERWCFVLYVVSRVCEGCWVAVPDISREQNDMTPEQIERAEWRRKNVTTRLTTLDEIRNEVDPPISGTMEELMGYMWELTVTACEIGGKYDAEQPLQRNVTRIIRPSR